MRRSLRLLAAITALGTMLAPVRAALDIAPAPGGDSVPDIWAIVTGFQGTDLAADSDGDGQANGAEAAAGTNPKDARDVLAIKSLTASGGNITVVFRGIAGKRYQVQSSASIQSPAFVTVPQATGIQKPIVDGDISVTLPMGSGSKYYRVFVSDVDSDNDGLTDYEELKLGLNKDLADSNADGTSDLAYVSGQLALPDVVTIVADDSSAGEDGTDYGRFTIKRTRNLFSIRVPYTVGGTATQGVDFQSLSGYVDLPMGSTSSSFSVIPIPEPSNVVESGESVTVTLADPLYSYSLGAAKSATVIIHETTVAGGKGLRGRYYDTASTTYSRPENFGTVSTYTYIKLTTTTGTATIAYAGTPALSVGDQVNIAFTAGSLNSVLYSPLIYTVTGVTATNFTVAITGTAVPNSQTTSSSAVISILSFPHPAVMTRLDPTVNFSWLYGTPNGVVIAPNNSPDNYSATWDGYLSPTTAGAYSFQLDADDKARVLLDLNDGNGLVQILEHGWDGPATLGTFKLSAAYTLAVPANPAARYHIRVEHVETTGDARCRLQWRLGAGAFANISSANVFTHTQTMTYNYIRTTGSTTAGSIVITPTGGHSFVGGETVALSFSSGNLFTPGAATSFNGNFTVSTVTGTASYTLLITGAALPASGTGSGFVVGNAASTATGLYNLCYANTSFSGSPGRVGVDAAVTSGNNGIWGAGTPDITSIAPDTFSVRWTGQVQPQYTEEYTFIVNCDDACALRINGQSQVLKVGATSAQTGAYSYDGTTGATVFTYSGLPVQPGAFAVGETVRLDPSSGNLAYAAGSAYTYDGTTGVAVIDYTNLANVAPSGFTVGETVFLDPTTGNLSALASLPYAITAVGVAPAKTFTVNFGTGAFASGAGVLTVSDVRECVVSASTTTTFTVNFGTGKSATGTGNMSIEALNKPLKDWGVLGGIDRYVRIPVIGGVRYDIQLDYFENVTSAACSLSWYSPSQPKQIIPTERLYPDSTPDVTLAPPILTSPASVVAFVGGPFSYRVSGSNASNVTVSGYPEWLTFSAGVLSGTPPSGAAGHYQIVVSTSGPLGTGTSVIEMDVQQNIGTVAREYWTGISGTSVSSIPTGSAPSGSSSLNSLEAPLDFGDNYGARVRGYITAPETGNYYFWIAAGDAAELWISNDDEQVNRIKRAWVAGGTASQEWNKVGESHQRSPWLALEQGQKYYFEILHKAGSGSGDNVAVGWLKAGQTGIAPSEIVPGYVLSPYVAPSPTTTPGTLFVATLLSQNGAATNAVGTATLRLSADETTAAVTVKYNGLSGTEAPFPTGKVAADGTTAIDGNPEPTDWHVHSDPYLNNQSYIIFDGAEPLSGDGPQFGPDGKFLYHKWNIISQGTLSVGDVIELLKEGKAYINLHTAANPNGEIRGNFTPAEGSRTFTPPPTPPTWADDHATDIGAQRFLTQATFGPNIADITALKGMASYEAWIDDQVTKQASHQLAEVFRTEGASAQGGNFTQNLTFNAWWWNSIAGADQLRQRVAFALSEIHVVSAQGPLDNNALALSYFYDHLSDHAFDNFRDILEATTLTPSMGRYLDMLRNDKPDLSIGRSPNENYAREIKQLFSVGLYNLWPDGTLVLTSKDELVPTYTQREIVGFAHCFTGWDYGYDGAYRTTLSATTNFTRPMREVPARHYTGPKRILNNEVLPGLITAGGQLIDPNSTPSPTQLNDPVFQALPGKELDATHEQLFNHPNVGPFICRQLIQRLVTSSPTRAYLYRVVSKFNDNGSGVRGDMKAVVKAILLDYEARSNGTPTSANAKPDFGKQREPIMRVAAAARAFRVNPFSGTYVQNGASAITVTSATPHKLVSGNQVFLDFTSGTPPPFIGAYSASVSNANTFTVTAPGWATGAYSIPANSTTCTVSMSNHWVISGFKVFMDFTSGGANGVAGLDQTVYTLLTATPETGVGNFTFAIDSAQVSSIARTGNCMIPRFTPGSYTVSNSGMPAPNEKRITLDTNFDHNLAVGDQVQLNFITGNPLPADFVGTVESIVDLNTYTVLSTATSNPNLNANQGDNGMYQFPLKSLPLVRNGNVTSRPSTFNVGSTTTELSQTPLNSPTVFNFFLPDFKYPGSLASQGITTPEFQLTAETFVMRQSQYLYNGIFNPGNTNGISSFNAGSNALVMDYSPWMAALAANDGLGAPASGTSAWTSNANLPTLIGHMNTLLTGGQISGAGVTKIQTFVSNTAYIPYNNTTPTETNKRDRLRAILHLVLTSADYTIQR